MELLAEENDSPEDLVAVLSKDLTSSASFHRIAEVLQAAGREEDALRWLQKGLNAFGELADAKLVESTLRLLIKFERFSEGTALGWRRFDQARDLAGYQLLQIAATSAGQWKEFRERAIYLLETQAPEPGSDAALVEIYLWEGDIERAWLCARARGAPEHLWMELARARELRHPAECAAIYERAVEQALLAFENSKQIIALIEHVHSLRVRAGELSTFHRWLDAVRQQHSTRSRFVATLNRYFPPGRA